MLQAQAKGSYNEAKDVTASAKDRVVDDTKDATGSAADSVNRGAEQAQQVRASLIVSPTRPSNCSCGHRFRNP